MKVRLSQAKDVIVINVLLWEEEHTVQKVAECHV